MTRIAVCLLALLGLSACAAAPESAQELPVAAAPQTAGWTQFATCQTITLTTEEIDFSAPIDAAPSLRVDRLIVEVPTTPEEQQQGLQGRFPLDDRTAMLFGFDGEHNPVLWMKDTPASLDMIFFDRDGLVFYIETGTEPNSERFISPHEPLPIATHVLEVPAGKSDALGIFPGLTRMTMEPQTTCEGVFAVG